MRRPRVVVTSGATSEPLDPVRVLTNRSSGKQGALIAEAFADRGAEVTLAAGACSVLPADAAREQMRVLRIETAEDLLHLLREILPETDILVMCAAVCDWRPKVRYVDKMKKTEGQESLTLEFVKNPDILKTVCADPALRPRVTVGFAAETSSTPEALIALARRKLADKGCDFVLANDVTPLGGGEAVFGGDAARETQWVKRGGDAESWGTMSKHRLASEIVRRSLDALKTASAAPLLALTLACVSLTSCGGDAGGKSKFAAIFTPRHERAAAKPALAAENPEFERIAKLKDGESGEFGPGRVVTLRKRYTSLSGDTCLVVETGGAAAKAVNEPPHDAKASSPDDNPLPPEGGVMPAEVKKAAPPAAPAENEANTKLLCKRQRWAMYPVYRSFKDEEGAR